MVKRGILLKANSTATSGDQGPRNRTRYTGIEAVRCSYPRGPTATASETLAGASGIGQEFLQGLGPHWKLQHLQWWCKRIVHVRVGEDHSPTAFGTLGIAQSRPCEGAVHC